MYIRKTKTRVINGVDHYTYRIVESRRDEHDKVKQRTLLNLGAHYMTLFQRRIIPYLLKE